MEARYKQATALGQTGVAHFEKIRKFSKINPERGP
jgi:hypothetical protein